MNVLVINGPNLARLDIRDSAIYGDMTYPQLVAHIDNAAQTQGFKADIRQSDDEATIIGWLHEAADKNLPVIINPAAFTHYSYAIRDAVVLVKAPVIEVHLSNSVVSGVSTGTIGGFGPNSYVLALIALKALLA
jgi:3-dehydroquinate dehydratase-2